MHSFALSCVTAYSAIEPKPTIAAIRCTLSSLLLFLIVLVLPLVVVLLLLLLLLLLPRLLLPLVVVLLVISTSTGTIAIILTTVTDLRCSHFPHFYCRRYRGFRMFALFVSISALLRS